MSSAPQDVRLSYHKTDILQWSTKESKQTTEQNGTAHDHKQKTSSEDTHLFEEQKITATAFLKLQRLVLIVSWASIFFSLITGIMGIVLSVKGRSESLFAYGLDAILDSLSSVAVVWRFHGTDLFSAERERRACIGVGLAFLVSAMSLIGKSIYSIITEAHESKNIVLYERFAAVCAVGSLLLATAKVILGYKTSSRALTNDSIITYVGAASCIAGVAGLELYIQDSDLWYLDSVFGIILGLFLLFFGLRLLVTSVRNR